MMMNQICDESRSISVDIDDTDERVLDGGAFNCYTRELTTTAVADSTSDSDSDTIIIIDPMVNAGNCAKGYYDRLVSNEPTVTRFGISNIHILYLFCRHAHEQTDSKHNGGYD
jgi:hypothetical protein